MSTIITNNTTNNTNTTRARQYYALSWYPSCAYQYDDDTIRDIDFVVADIIIFDSKAERDEYVADESYVEAISARRAYRINPSVRPGFGRKRAACWF